MAYDRAVQPVRWLVLALACISMLGPYYAYDIPSALDDKFEIPSGKSNDTESSTSGPDNFAHFNLTSTQFNLLYSVYSFPNMILPFFGGYLVDRFGTNMTLFTFLLLINIGQAIFAIAVTIRSYPLALVGRIFFGFGGESLSVAQSTLVALWFKGKEVAFAMGFNLAVARLGSVANDLLSPVAYEKGGLPYAVFFGLFMCALALASACILIMVERNAARKYRESQRANDMGAVVATEYTPLNEDDAQAHTQRTGQEEAKEEPVGEQISCSEVKTFPLSYWLICISCVVVYAAVLPFNNIAEKLIKDKYGYTTTEADHVLLIIYSISAAFSPFLGGVVDKFGKRAVLVTVAGGTLGAAHMIIGFSGVIPYVPMSIIGLSYAVYAAAIWPSVTYVVQQHQLGTAYGVITAIQNAGLGLTPLVVGSIEDSTNDDWRFVELFFACVAFFGVLVGFWLNFVDAKAGGVLNRATQVIKSTDQDPLLDTPQLDASGGGAGAAYEYTERTSSSRPARVAYEATYSDDDGDNGPVQRISVA